MPPGLSMTCASEPGEALDRKRFERSGDTVRLLPRNPAYQPIVVGPDQDLAIEGVFCGLVRQG